MALGEKTAGREFLERSLDEFKRYKKMAEDVFDQVEDEGLNFRPDPESLTIYLMAKHLAGNMKSRWVDFLTTDGEKRDRNRDTEFEEEGEPSRRRMIEMWEEGWGYLFEALADLTDENMQDTVTIRGEPHTVIQAIQRQVAHYAYHVGQIVYVGKHLKGDAWRSLSIPKGKSDEFLGWAGDRK
ncbi:MAG: DUF1572 domain-containing protein [Gemmatimonadota bacterium]|nr:DUF1572 domain-containing protein [Gemmatimonadota bacterium]